MSHRYWAGVDIGGTKTAVVLSSEPPHVHSRIEFATLPSHGPKPALNQIIAGIQAMLAEHGITASDLRGIGISCGGPLDRNKGIIQSPPNLPSWIEVPIVEILSHEFCCSVRLENDANAGAVAEYRFGAGQGFSNMIFLTMGTGLGSGIILNNQLYFGTNDMAGEIGHVRLTRSGPTGYNKAGSAEGWASGAGMAQIAARFLQRSKQKGHKSILFEQALKGSLTARDVGLAAQAGDAVAIRIVNTSGKKMGEALAILVDILNPECIVVGGLAMRLGELILKPARMAMKREALKQAVDVCRLVPSSLGERIGDVAALCIAMDAGQHASTENLKGKK